MRKFLLFSLAALMAVGFGCTKRIRPPSYARPPRRIDWQDPISVMHGFLSAKKWGDWRTAFRCCDYEETLPKEESAKIKKQWKEESRKWPVDYANTFWIITGHDFKGDTAVLKILVARRDPLTRALRPNETYEETLKMYKGKWKITSLLALKER